MMLRTAHNPLCTTLLAVSLALGCAGSPDVAPPAVPAAIVPADLDSLAVAHDAAWNAHDPDALAALFVDQAVVVTPVGRRVEGRAAVRELFAEPGPTKQTTSSSRVDSVRAIDGEHAFVTMTHTLSGPGVEQIPSPQARLVGLARRSDRSWQLVEAHVFPMPGKAGTP